MQAVNPLKPLNQVVW